MSYTVAEERMQNYIEELEQENRLLRARNDRLEAEAKAVSVQDEAWKADQKALADAAIKCATEAIADVNGPIKAVREYYGATTIQARV
jgi:hypothetical protein